MDRREFISMKRAGLASPKGVRVSNRTTSTGLTKYSGSWTQAEAKHLLARTLFGYKTSELASFTSKGLDTAVADILNVSTTAPDPPVNNYSSSDPNVPLGQTWVNNLPDPTYEFQRRVSFKTWWVGLMIDQSPTILEKMTLFWHNHFATQTEIIGDSRMIYTLGALLRANAMGNFKDLVKKVTKDAGMLIYLNGALNTKAAPDENYARELQELFCVGKGPGSQYTEDDVKAAARVLTGWRVLRGSNPVIVNFDATKHDVDDKVFSSFYSNTTVTGRTGSTAGDLELDDLLNMIFSVDEVALFICRKLYRYFVYYEIDTNAETNVIAPLAVIFRTNNYDIKPVLEKLFLSEHFYDMANRGCYIKTPLDHVIGFARQTEVAFPMVSNGVSTQYEHWALWQFYAAIIGLDIGDPPNVAGWPAWYQEPQYYETWINSDSLPKRNQFSDYLLYVGYNKSGFTTKPNVFEMAERTSDPKDPNTLIDETLAFLLPMEASADLKAKMKEALLPGGIPDYNWTNAWNLYKTDPGNTANTKNVELLLFLMYKAIMNLSEYQLS